MSELEFGKLAIQAGFGGIAAGLVLVLFNLVRGNQTSEQGLMRIVETLLNTMTDKFADMNLKTQQRHEQMIERVVSRQDQAFKAQIEAIGSHMLPIVERRDAQLEAMPQRIREEMAQDLGRLPQAIEAVLTPRIETLKTDIAAMIADLAQKTERIEAATGNIPNETTALLRSDLNALRTTFETSLEEMKQIISQLTQDDAAESGATTSAEQSAQEID